MDTPPLPPQKILVVEDDQFLRDLYVDILTSAGYEVQQASDGEEGYKLIHQGGYDLVLLDIMLPKIDGISILKLAQATPPEKSNRHIVILSNLGQDSIIAEAVNLGARGYMIKSELTPEQALNEVKRYLSES
ncbi:MAG: response regulator [Patescibacteria group bacterium]|jgi:DNA-binding response OmpR family regulator